MVVIAVMVMMTVRSQLVLDCKRDYPIRSVVMYRDPQATGGMSVGVCVCVCLREHDRGKFEVGQSVDGPNHRSLNEASVLKDARSEIRLEHQHPI